MNLAVNLVETQLKMLMAAGLAGNATAYRHLLEAAAVRLIGYYARRLGADCADLEDLVQDTLVAIHNRRESYDQALPFTAWLHSIARYKLIDHLRKQGIRKQVSIDDIGDIAATDEFEACLASADVERLLAELPEKHRLSIQLTRIQGHSAVETAAITGQTLSAVKTNVHRGMKRLMARVKGRSADD